MQAALRALNQHERFLRHHFPQSLLVEFSVAANNQTKSAVPAPKVESDRGWISFDQLELMDDMQLQERVEVARIQEMALQSSEVELSELNRLICGAQGLENVQADRNPMRPETYSRTLRATLLATNESLAVRLAWMQHMGEILGRSLAVTYAQLSKMLRDLGVQPAGYQVSMAPQMGRTGMFMVDGVQMVPVGPGGVPATLVPLSAHDAAVDPGPPLGAGHTRARCHRAPGSPLQAPGHHPTTRRPVFAAAARLDQRIAAAAQRTALAARFAQHPALATARATTALSWPCTIAHARPHACTSAVPRTSGPAQRRQATDPVALAPTALGRARCAPCCAGWLSHLVDWAPGSPGQPAQARFF